MEGDYSFEEFGKGTGGGDGGVTLEGGRSEGSNGCPV